MLGRALSPDKVVGKVCARQNRAFRQDGDVDSRTAIDLLDRAPRLGWVNQPTPLESNRSLAAQVGLAELWCKRDDLAGPVRGGSKARKLDFILARAPFRDADSWASSGAIGSSHLLALADAATVLERRVEAYAFWIPPTDTVLATLKAITDGPASIRYQRTRVGLGLRYPNLFVGSRVAGVPVVAPGGTDPIGTLGMVRAGLELAAQLPSEPPSRLYLAVGSGGAAAGIAIGLGLAEVPIEVHAVSVVERVLLSRARFDRVVRSAVAELSHLMPIPAGFAPAPVVIRSEHLGSGYGVATDASTAAAAQLQGASLPGEGIYTGKAFDCLRADAASGVVDRAVFWMSGSGVAGADPSPAEEPGSSWQLGLPRRLQVALARAGSVI